MGMAHLGHTGHRYERSDGDRDRDCRPAIDDAYRDGKEKQLLMRSIRIKMGC